MSFFRYPGGKSKLRAEIAKRLSEQAGGPGLEYREPFFGGGSIGLSLISGDAGVGKVWINDKDVGIACLWTAVIQYREDFEKRVLDFTPTVAEFHRMRDELMGVAAMPTRRIDVVDVGFKKLAVHQTSYSGLGTKSGGPLGGAKQESAYKIGCRWSPQYICKKLDRIGEQFASVGVRGGGCSNLDFAELIGDTSCDALLYLDPPYFVKGNDLYQCGFTEDDHGRLAGALRATKHPWVLSYDDCPEIRELYSWACVHCLDVSYSITATKNKDTGERLSRSKSELLISSNPTQ